MQSRRVACFCFFLNVLKKIKNNCFFKLTFLIHFKKNQKQSLLDFPSTPLMVYFDCSKV
jgi:hypothetical protein